MSEWMIGRIEAQKLGDTVHRQRSLITYDIFRIF